MSTDKPAGLDLAVRAMVLQPTPLCNLRCTYCYLPDVGDRSRMDPVIPVLLADQLPTALAKGAMRLEWHAGEPLVLGIDRLTGLLEPFEDLRRGGMVGHSLQTNATLVSDAWCKFFKRFDVRVGVSIDGPRWANGQRRTLSQAEAFDRTMAGIGRLRQHDIAFAAIAVVSLQQVPEIVRRVDDFLAFFRSLDATIVGFNIEEHEGRHRVIDAYPGMARMFWDALFDAWSRGGMQPRIRDFTRVLDFARDSMEGRSRQVPLDLIPTITHDGDVVVLSPELAGYTAEAGRDFSLGNVLHEPLEVILSRAPAAWYVRDFVAGTRSCQERCRYFGYCPGGQASNRYFENGDLTRNETAFCRNSWQRPFDAVLGMK